MCDAPGALADKARLPHSRNAVPRKRGSGKVHRRTTLKEEENAMKQSWIKRIFSFVLALVMVLGMIPAGVIHVPHAHAATDPSKYDLVIDFDYQTENNVKTPEEALELVKDESLSDMSRPTLSRSVYDGDVDELREWLEDPSDSTQIIQLQEDVTILTEDAFETIKITGDKILDLNGYTLEVWDASNGKFIPWLDYPLSEGDQKTTVSNHHSYIFQISQGATLTVIDSGGTKENPGRIYANATMINHQKWDFLYYTHRDIFHLLDGNLVIYGGEFQAGRQRDQLKSNFSWTKLKNVIGQAVVLGTNILEYTSGISAAEAADLDLKEELFLSKDNKDTEGEDDGKGDKGAAAKKTGEDATKDTKKDTPASTGAQGDKSQQAEQTVAQKQNGKNNGTQDGASKGDQSGENKANKDKPAKEEGKWTQLAKSEKAIASAKWDKDKIGNVVNSAFDLAEGIAGLLGTDERSRATACIQGTVAKVSNGGTLVIYDGYFIGHGSTPNVRNAVIEVETSNVKNTNPQSLHYGKNTGGYVYVYGGTFDAMTGANVFNMVVTKTNQKQFTYTTDSSGNIVATEVTLPKHETQNMQVLRYDPASLAEWQAGYDAIDASDTAALEAYPNPELVNTANVVVRGGTFRCYYEPIIMSVLENKKEGSWCPDCQKYDDSCDGIDHHIFNGTAGSVNLGVASFDQDLIKDGRIQIVDVYGQGKLVLLDGGEPIYPDGEPASGNNNSYQTEGGFRQYRLFCGDTELRVSSYLMVYPNDAKTNSSNSMALRTYWGTGDDLSDMWDSATPKEEKEWPADMDNIRAPYSSNEKYIEFVYDDNEDDGDGISANYYVIPNLKNTDPMGSNLNSSNVWYYNVPVDANEEPIVPKVRYFDYDKLMQSGQIVSQDVEYATNIKWFNYKVYRVDPLSRENISENGIPCENDDNPLIEVCYGASPESLKCKLPLLYLEEQIKARVPGWDGYDSGEMYRIVFSVEEHLAYGFNTESEFDNTMTKASAESSILFLCVSKDELKKENYTNPNTGKESVHYVPDWTPLHFTTDTLIAGSDATVQLIEGQTGLVDWVGDKVFDVYYQWWEVDENGNEIRLLAGTDNIWVAQDTVGKNNHRPSNWIIGEDGNGINDELYANTVDPDSAAASQYEYFPNGLPKNTENPEKSGALWSHEMLHMYTLETTGQNEGLKARPNESLNMGNNNAFWGNTDSCYIPAELVGKYVKVRVIAVNCQYPTYYDNKQTYESHVIKVEGPELPEFDTVTPGVTAAELEKGSKNLGTFLESPKFAFTYPELENKYLKAGYELKPTINVRNVANGQNSDVCFTREDCAEGYEVRIGLGRYAVELRLTLLSPSGVELDHRKMTYNMTLGYTPRITSMTPAPTAEELAAGVTNLGRLDEPISFSFTYDDTPLPEWLAIKGYEIRAYSNIYQDGKLLGGVDADKPWTPSGFGDRAVTHIVELYSYQDGKAVSTTSHTFTFSLGAPEMKYEWLSPVPPEADRSAGVTNYGTIEDAPTFNLDFDPTEIPEWMRDAGIGLEGSMTIKRNGEVIFENDGVAYKPENRAGEYEAILEVRLTDRQNKVIDKIQHRYTYTIAAAEIGRIWFHNNGTTKLPVENRTMGVGETYQIYYDIEPVNAIDDLVWTSSNSAVATVDQNGFVSAVGVGSAVIMASNADGSISDTMTIQVTNPGLVIVSGVGLQIGQYLAQGAAEPTTEMPDDNYVYLRQGEYSLELVMHNYTHEGMGCYYSYDQCAILFPDANETVSIVLEGDNRIDMSAFTSESGSNFSYGIVMQEAGFIEGDGTLTFTNVGTAIYAVSGELGISSTTINTENTGDFIGSKNVIAVYIYNTSMDLKLKAFFLEGYTEFDSCDVTITAIGKNAPIQMGGSYDELSLYDTNLTIISPNSDGIYHTGSGSIDFNDSNVRIDALHHGIWTSSSPTTFNGGNLLITSAMEGNPAAAHTDDNSLAFRLTYSATVAYSSGLYAYGSAENDGSNGETYTTDNLGVYDFIFIGTDPRVFNTDVYVDPDCTVVWDAAYPLTQYDNVSILHKHTLEHHAEIPAGCETEGVCEYWYCTGCRKMYADEACTIRITETTLEALDHDWMHNTCTEPRHCLRCGLTDERYPATGHSWYPATCTNPMMCRWCDATMGTPIEHVWVEADCNYGEHCEMCWLERTDPLGHILEGEIIVPEWDEINCSWGIQAQQYCSRCEEYVWIYVEADPSAHHWVGGDCENPAQCEYCEVYSSVPIGHQWEDATCETPKTCSVCHATEGSALGHNWAEATCTTPKRCASCGVTEGSALGHNWIDATCTEPKTCDRCMLTDGAPLEHTWDVSDCTQARTCTGCGETREAGVHTLTTDDLRHQGTCESCGMTIASELHTFGDDDFCDVCGHEVKLVELVELKLDKHACGKHPDMTVEIVNEDGTFTAQVDYWYNVHQPSEKYYEDYTFTCGKAYAAYITVNMPTGYRFEQGKTVIKVNNGNPITGFASASMKSASFRVFNSWIGIAHRSEVEATCTTDGCLAHYYCPTCGKTYATAAGSTPISAEELIIPALGHDYVDGTCTRCGIAEEGDGPQIVSQPVDYVGMVGDNATFTVVAEGEDLSYQWYYFDNAASDWKKSSNGTTATLSVEFKEYRNNQQYRCEITDADGNTVTTNTVKITAKVVDLVIVTQPVSAMGSVNEQMSYTVEATGNGLTYQWYYSDDGGTTWKISGTPGFATNTLLPILRDYRDGYKYYCQITDIFGNTVNSNVVSMDVKTSEITITNQPDDINDGLIGELHTFKVTATGENLDYRWEYSNDGGATWQLSWNEGYYTDTLTVRLLAARDGYLYRCKITSGLKVVEYTDAVELNLQAPSATIVKQPTNVAVVAGKSIQFQVQATGNHLTYEWYRSNDDGATWIRTYLDGCTTDTLAFTATTSRAALYMCRIVDGSGTEIWTNRVKLRILSAELQILTQPESVTCANGATATFHVEAQGDNLKYQWYASADGGATWTITYLDGSTTDTLSFAVTAARAAKLYKCVVTDIGGNTVETNAVSVTIG